MHVAPSLSPINGLLRLLPGLGLAALLAAISIGLSRTPALQTAGLSGLTVAIVLGIVLGNTIFPSIAGRMGAGTDFAKAWLLRAGVVLYGLRVTFQDIAAVGLDGVLIAVAMVASVFVLALTLGTRVFGLDRDTSILIGSGSAICGAAAVLATEPVLRAPPHKAAVAVATVVVFGTLSMFLYPLLYAWSGLDAHGYGLYVGSTVHEVAQVVVAGRAVDDTAAAAAVIEKMLRVMLLAPFLLLLSAWLARGRHDGESGKAIVIPWFAVGFIAVSGLNSLHLLPPTLHAALIELDAFVLAMAMTALGLRTHVSAIRKAGLRPMLLAASLFAYLVLGGYALNLAITAW